MTVDEQLIGRKFKRVKYGTSTFTGTITEVMIVFEKYYTLGQNYSKPFKHEKACILVKSENGIVYSLNEIVLV